jgi:hypothetical protein
MDDPSWTLGRHGVNIDTWLQLTALPAYARRLALAIGNDAHQHVDRLNNAGSDAQAVAEALKQTGLRSNEQILKRVRDQVVSLARSAKHEHGPQTRRIGCNQRSPSRH